MAGERERHDREAGDAAGSEQAAHDPQPDRHPGQVGLVVGADLLQRVRRPGDQRLVGVLPGRDPRRRRRRRRRSRSRTWAVSGRGRRAGRRAARPGPSSATGRRAAARGSGPPAAAARAAPPARSAPGPPPPGRGRRGRRSRRCRAACTPAGSTATRAPGPRAPRRRPGRRRRCSKASQLAPGHQLGQLGHHLLRRRPRRTSTTALAVERRAAVVDQPARGALDQGAHLDPHPGLTLGVDLVVEGADLVAQRQRAEDLAGHEVGARQLGRGRRRSPPTAGGRR